MEDLLSKLFFKLRLHESEGMEFQVLFNKLMQSADDNFHSIQQYGGDGGCDGYSPKFNMHFAVTTQRDKLDKKFEEDFIKYKNAPKADTFTFVCAKTDMSRKLSDKIQEYQNDNPSIKIEHWNFDKILARFSNLPIEKRKTVLNDIPIPKGDSNSAVTYIIQDILIKINKEPLTFSSIGTSSITELKDKINGNNVILLSSWIEKASNLKTAKIFFDKNTEEKEKIRKYINALYQKNKDKEDADIIIWKVMEACYDITEGNFLNLLSIVTVFIEECDLLENIKANKDL